MAKGQFLPKHPEKYIGNTSEIYFRSSWELRFFQFCDNNLNVLRWASEEIKIPYLKPTDTGKNKGKIRHYYPDVYIEYKNSSGEIVKELIEIKPLKETVLTKKSTVYDKVAIAINEAKWNAAHSFCEKNGLKFRILTEKSLFRT